MARISFVTCENSKAKEAMASGSLVSVSKPYIPFAVKYLSVRLNTDTTVGFFIWHHHVRFTCVITVGIWDPDVLNITSFYGKGGVEFSS